MIKSRDSSIGIATGYWMEGWGSIHGIGKVFLFSIAFISALGPTSLLSNKYRGPFPRG
jgi:hypothetical protein